MKTLSKFAVTALALAISATTAQAQINYSTEGQFVSAFGTCNTALGFTAVCSGGGFTLTYTGVPTQAVPYGSGTIASLGTFTLTGTGNVTVPPATVGFNLAITQTLPTGGTNTFMGFISGTVSTSPFNSSTLVWRPTQQTLAIGNVTYQMIYDNVGPGANEGIGISITTAQPTSINALVTVPEPSSVILMASGLMGLAGVAIRRRRNNA